MKFIRICKSILMRMEAYNGADEANKIIFQGLSLKAREIGSVDLSTLFPAEKFKVGQTCGRKLGHIVYISIIDIGNGIMRMKGQKIP